MFGYVGELANWSARVVLFLKIIRYSHFKKKNMQISKVSFLSYTGS